ncbi:MAG: hypothetical protein SFZ03_10785 [Candidatus Melainabacteria bacterium]|nr:hypothetical protein [Candidatus Melainabacteria bacterium]
MAPNALFKAGEVLLDAGRRLATQKGWGESLFIAGLVAAQKSIGSMFRLRFNTGNDNQKALVVRESAVLLTTFGLAAVTHKAIGRNVFNQMAKDLVEAMPAGLKKLGVFTEQSVGYALNFAGVAGPSYAFSEVVGNNMGRREAAHERELELQQMAKAESLENTQSIDAMNRFVQTLAGAISNIRQAVVADNATGERVLPQFGSYYNRGNMMATPGQRLSVISPAAAVGLSAPGLRTGGAPAALNAHHPVVAFSSAPSAAMPPAPSFAQTSAFTALGGQQRLW